MTLINRLLMSFFAASLIRFPQSTNKGLQPITCQNAFDQFNRTIRTEPFQLSFDFQMFSSPSISGNVEVTQKNAGTGETLLKLNSRFETISKNVWVYFNGTNMYKFYQNQNHCRKYILSAETTVSMLHFLLPNLDYSRPVSACMLIWFLSYLINPIFNSNLVEFNKQTNISFSDGVETCKYKYEFGSMMISNDTDLTSPLIQITFEQEQKVHHIYYGFELISDSMFRFDQFELPQICTITTEAYETTFDLVEEMFIL